MRPRGAIGVPVLAALAGCLLAPGRPGATGDGGPGGDGSAGTDAGLGTCLDPADTAGPSVAVDITGSGHDTLFRLGFRGSAAVVYEFDEPLTNTRCAQTITTLAPVVDTNPIGKLDAISAGSATGALRVVAYVSAATGAYAEVHVLTGTALVDSGHAEDGLAPMPVPVAGGGADAPAFVSLVGAGSDTTVWFGGGATLGVFPIDSPGGSADAVQISNGSDDVWYAGAEDRRGTVTTVDLVSRSFVAEASVDIPSHTVMLFGPEAAPECGGAPPCPTALARPVDHPAHPGLFYSSFYVSPAIDHVALVGDNDLRNDAMLPSLAGTPAASGALADAVVDLFSGSDHTDLGALWVTPASGGQAYAVVYTDLGSDGASPHVSVPYPVAAAATRVTAVRDGTTVALLLLTNHPGVEPSDCLTLATGSGSSTLVPCAR